MARPCGSRFRQDAPSTWPTSCSRQFDLPEEALYRVHGPVNLVRLNQLVDLVDEPRLRFPAYKAVYPTQLVPGQSIFEQLRRGDVLIHQPYESFDGVLEFLREAVQ